jgi:bifunctional DNase/RNase
MAVRMELHQIIISDLQDAQLIVLKEVDGERKFHIVIGSTEAHAIDRRLKGHLPPRPQTHDLLATVIEALGGTLEKIEITRLEDRTFFCSLHIRTGTNNGKPGKKVVEVDSRPSDAIAIGIATGVPIWVAEQVLDAVAS